MIEEILDKDMMIFDLKSKDKLSVLKELIKPLAAKGAIDDEDKFLDVVLKREEEYSTGIGMGVAIPHGKSSLVKKASLVFGKSKEGIDYNSMDGKPAHLFFLIAAPENSDNLHLKILAKLSRSLMHEEVREELNKAETYEDVVNAFKKYE
ncbi:putative PTS IIA-like protein nitrogen-regulatory protein PtsN [Thermoanaerobacterium thermosaccharolyticum DSM 571]|jgi:nitrogen PTS system EIIA component|uniref:Putative PTS IIA-like protein nitrogen-regulatory protein PtsN n=1 Tax=Thermoanaerobacterium thermosaccharolyticum (strain ATCC 7956 / DSM 571 / NCIMB 9385 / NCA 3814 / NCTC 13789 / WDCM 00135 / 2032) TaxID=580327 RepID=D9TLS0_THETC|nr:fructose PTS transporter subunit IIA [Thermoanaerobacterium thermosaccharolyticum]ADL70006.1 putative PTS IIA-like protein nitrogen-regulatory protein PtsN [Thermoanaerobacterium thermosaccharolyticum DSM 571]MCP2238869.1 PTS system nitrogen regulatory IIA component [Thermoanaerobacterium thermosaccharolyticum]